MTRSRRLSLLEAAANVAAGFGLALVAQVAAVPVLGLQTSLRQNAALSAIFTLVSLGRSYVLRRLFARIGRGDVDGGG